MNLLKLFRKNDLKAHEIKKKFENLLEEDNNIEKASQYLKAICKQSKRKCLQYSKIFFNVFKDIDTKLAIEVMVPHILKENDISFLKVYITRLKKTGEIKLANKLLKKIGEEELKLSKSEIKAILNKSDDKEIVIQQLLQDLPYQRDNILFNAFSILKDEYRDTAIKYGLEYLKLNHNDFRFFTTLKKRIDKKLLNSEELEFFNSLNGKIQYFNKIKKVLVIEKKQYQLKKNLEIAIKKLNDEQLIRKLIEELFTTSPINKELVYKIVFNVLRNAQYEKLALNIGDKYLKQNPSDKKFKRSLKKLEIISSESCQKDFEQKIADLIKLNNFSKKFINKQFIQFINTIKDTDDLEFDWIIAELKKRYPNRTTDIDSIIFSELKDYNVYRAIRYGKKYIKKNLDDCKFLKVFFKRLERTNNHKDMYAYANEAVKFCSDKEIEYIKFKHELSVDLAELQDLNREMQKNLIEKLEIKYEDYKVLLYRELFSFYKNISYELAEEYAAKSLKLKYNEYLVKDLYDLHIYYGALTKAYSVLPEEPKLPTLNIKKKNILSLLSLYKNGFDLNIEKNHAYIPDKNKVLYMLHNRLPYNSGGYATRSHGLLTGVSKYGWNMHGVSRLGYPLDKIKNVEINDIDIVDGIPYHILSKDDIGLGKLSLKDYLEEYARNLLEFAKKEKPYIIHAASNYMNGVVANYVAKCLGIKSIYEVRGLWELTRISRQPEWENTEYYNLMSKMEAEAAQGADYVFTLTNALKDEMIRRGVDGDKIFILPNGVVSERFSPLTKNTKLATQLNINNKTVIGFIGSFVQYEGLEYIVDAIEILVRKGKKDIVALMVGDGAVWQDIVDRVKEKELDKYFIFTGRIPHQDVEEYYSLVDIAPLPRKGLPVCEMVSPLKPFEAMAMEKVVLSSNVAALAEIVQDGFNGMLFEKDNVEDLAKKIEILANDEKLREQLGKQARKWVLESRDWQNIAETLHHSYQKLKEIK